MISGYFGVPGCGKTTILTRIAQKELRRIRKGKSKYRHVLTNFYCEGCERVQLNDYKRYVTHDSLVLLDELTIDADSRSHKSFPPEVKEFIVMHRHLGNDIIYFIQDYSRVDKTIRELTFDLWYVRKPVLPFFNRFSVARRIFRNITINEFTSDLVLGYRFSKFLERLFVPKGTVKIIYRPPWYKYFDSFDEGNLASVPELEYIPWDDITIKSDIISLQ